MGKVLDRWHPNLQGVVRQLPRRPSEDWRKVTAAVSHMEPSPRELTGDVRRDHGNAPGDAVGISWLLRDVEGVHVVAHGGDTSGQHSTFEMVRERGFAITSLTNCGPNGSEFNEEITR